MSTVTPPSTPLPTSTVADECEEAPGRAVQQLDDVTIPAVSVPAIVDTSGDRRFELELQPSAR